jgi:hypothetical protein
VRDLAIAFFVVDGAIVFWVRGMIWRSRFGKKDNWAIAFCGGDWAIVFLMGGWAIVFLVGGGAIVFWVR